MSQKIKKEDIKAVMKWVSSFQMTTMTPEARSARAQHAANVRHGNEKKHEKKNPKNKKR